MASKSLLLNLPYEIRREIYLYCLPTQQLVDTITSFCILSREGKGIGLFRVSKQVSEETLDIAYAENLFLLQVSKDHIVSLKLMTEANRRRIRHLVVMPHLTRFYFVGTKMDNRLWASILENLRQFHLILSPDYIPSEYDQTEEDRGIWVSWNGSIEVFCKFIGHHLSSETVVEVEHNGGATLRELIRKYFPAGYQETEYLKDIWGYTKADESSPYRHAFHFRKRLVYTSSGAIVRRKGLFVFN